MTPEQIKEAKVKADKEAADKLAAEAKVKADKEIAEKEDDIDKELELFDNHQKFATLHFLMWNGKEYNKKALKESAVKIYDKLEEDLKKCGGKVAKVSKTVSLGIGMNLKIVEGIPTPDSVYQKFVEAKKLNKNLDIDKLFE